MSILVIGATRLSCTNTARPLFHKHEVIGTSRKGATLTVGIADKALSAALSPQQRKPVR